MTENQINTKMAKLRKTLTPTMIEDLEAMDEQQLHDRIVQAETNIHEIDKEEEANVQLKVLKEQLKDAAAGFKDGKKFQKAITSYCLCLLEQNGKI